MIVIDKINYGIMIVFSETKQKPMGVNLNFIHRQEKDEA